MRRTSRSAVASIVLGVLSVTGGGPLGIVAIVLGRRAIRQIGQTGDEGYGLAQAGITLGWIAIILTIPGLILILIANFLSGQPTYGYGAPVGPELMWLI